MNAHTNPRIGVYRISADIPPREIPHRALQGDISMTATGLNPMSQCCRLEAFATGVFYAMTSIPAPQNRRIQEVSLCEHLRNLHQCLPFEDFLPVRDLGAPLGTILRPQMSPKPSGVKRGSITVMIVGFRLAISYSRHSSVVMISCPMLRRCSPNVKICERNKPVHMGTSEF